MTLSREVILGCAALILAVSCSKDPFPPSPAPPPSVAISPATPENPMTPTVLDTSLAGTWFAGDAVTLNADLDRFLAQAEDRKLEGLTGLVLPHAGYRYSGAVAAWGARQLVGRRFTRVMVLGPSHRVCLENTLSVTRATVFRTPLGQVPIDRAGIARMEAAGIPLGQPELLEEEHSVQIEVPFLQRTLGSFSLVPVVVGRLTEAAARRIGSLLAPLWDDQTLLVVSTDFTHYGPNYGYRPFTEDVEANLKALDQRVFATLESRDLRGFLRCLEETRATVCGHDPLALMLAMLGSEQRISRLTYDTSGRLTGDFRNSVSYLSAAITGRRPSAVADRLPVEARANLLKLARASITARFAGRKTERPEDLGVEITPEMRQVMGAFVTLTLGHALRGCIGEIEPRRPVCQAVASQALSSAFGDPRFEPVTAEEFSRIRIEISALLPPHPVASWRDIVLGRHGIVLAKDGRRAVFLPQVPVEQDWDLETTLRHLARKASLDEDAWREGAVFSVFEAEVFQEENR